MKIKSFIFVLAAMVAFTACQSNGNSQTVTLSNRIDSVSYALGVLIGQNNKSSLDATAGAEDVDLDLMISAFTEQVKGGESQIDADEAMQLIQTFFAEAESAKADQNAEEGAAFLAQNKLRDGVVTTESGLQYEVLTEGDGAKPTAEQTVTCDYTGTLIDGTVFDSSVDRGQPATFQLNQVIPGWTEALQLMPVGSKWKIYIPSDLGYGEAGVSSGEIGPNETLIFEVELLSIED